MRLPTPAGKYDAQDQSETRRLIEREVQSLQNSVSQATLGKQIKTVTAAYSLTQYDDTVLVDATAAPVTVTYPAASLVTGKEYTVKKIDASAHAVTLAATIDGVASPTLAVQYASKRAQSSGSAYFAT